MQKKIKIVHCISSLKIGGAEAVLVELLGSMYEYDHVVIYFHTGPHVDSIKKLGISAYHIKGLVCLYDPIFWYRLYKVLRKIKPELLHGSLWAANFAMRILGYLLKIPTICSLHAHADINGTIRRLLDRCCPQPDRFVAVSQAVRSSCLATEKWISAEKLITIQGGIDIQRVNAYCINQKINRSAFNFSEDVFIIGTVGRFSPEKNFSVLIDAFAIVHAKYPHTRLLFVGYGQEEKALRSLVLKYDLTDKVIFVIGQPAYGYYSLMDCFVLPSKSESLSLALLEAMTSGVPCIMSSFEYKHDILVDKKNGLLVPINDVRGFANAINLLIVDEKLRKQLTAEAQKMVTETCDSAFMVEGYQKLYTALLERQV